MEKADRAADRSAALFGSWDGVLSCFGVLVALYAVSTADTIVRAGVGAAVAAAISMGTGEYEADTRSSYRRAVIMGSCTGLGAFLPALPFLFLSRKAGLVTAGLLALAVSFVVAHVRHRSMGKPRWTYLTSPAVLVVAAGITYVVSALVPQSAAG